MAREPREKTAERLGANVKQLREVASVSQAELARRMTERGWPWHQSTVYRVESGRQPMRFEEAVDLADILDVTLDRLTWATGEAGERERVDDAHNRLRDSMVEAVEAVSRFHAARTTAGRASHDAATSHYSHVREAAALIDEELQHATIRNVLIAAQDLWMEQGGRLDSADAALLGIGSGDLPRRGNAIRAAAALYGQAVLADVDPQFLSRLTEGMDAGMVDEVIAAVAAAAGERGDGKVLKHIRAAGLQRLAADRLAAELTRLLRGPSDREFHAFLNQHKDSIGSGRDEAISYIDRGGDMVGLASLFAAKFTPQELAELVRLRQPAADPEAEVSSPTAAQDKVRMKEG
jgi:transcriptional regulator with XRE-family HTH domain